VPDWTPFLQPKAPEGAPNVLVVVWDDVGYGAMDVFGGPIETPTMRRIADAGLCYSDFHTTALCSPTRSSLLTGRNATSNNMACITEGSAGFPGPEWIERYRGRFDQGYEAIRAEILADQKRLGLLPDETELSPINPHGEPETTGPLGQPWPGLDFVRP
jgi:arylsulfatase A-like enzyme